MTENLKTIPPEDFVCLDDYAGTHPLRVDTVYSKPGHQDNMFKSNIYRAGAKMWAHKDLAKVILRAADICHSETGYTFELKDCLRTLEAQQAIFDSEIVQSHPQWLEEPRLFSPPGKGGHPRGMAVDIILIDKDGGEVDMGTRFDYLTEDKSVNPAARDYTDFGRGDDYNKMVLKNREILTSAMLRAARECGVEIVPLPQEWWDFRFPNSYTAQFAPVSDRDLPSHMRMTDVQPVPPRAEPPSPPFG